MLARLSLRGRFLMPVIFVIIAGMGASALISYIRSKQAMESVIYAEINQLAQSAMTTIESWVGDLRLDVNNWSGLTLFTTALKDTFVGKSARKTANQQLADLKKDYQYYENLCVANAAGEILMAADESVIGTVSVKDRSYFQSAMEGKSSLSEVIKSRGTGNPIFVIAAPIKDKEGVAGVFFAVVDLNAFSSRFVDPIKVGQTGYAYLFQEDGTVIAHPDKANILKLNLKEFDFGREMMAKGQGSIVYTFQGVERIVGFQKSKILGWTIGVGAATDEALGPIRSLGYTNIGIAFAVVVLAGVLILFLVQSIVKPLQKITEGLGEASLQVSSGAAQISKSSQSLAEGASEQAASIEETSSSLEEMSAMTKQNADNAHEADTLMNQANEVIAKANVSMGHLTESMQQISKASEETSKIIKTIDEIAFQTNLLALNAAVEAARAGEAGAGFAVVADEVRNLAMRAAEAAKNTSTLIEGTVKRIKDGSDLVTKTNEDFGEVAKRADSVGKLVAEIAAASHEQAQGIEQINKAVNEMDKVVQQNAASAEESAGASEEMSSQAEEMKRATRDLLRLVQGQGAQTDALGAEAHDTLRVPDPPQKRAPLAGGAARPKRSTIQGRGQRPEEVIPLNEEEFKDF